MRKRFVLLKDTAELKKGAILEEKSDDGTQPYIVIQGSANAGEDATLYYYNRAIVETQPEWFEEIQTLWVPSKIAEKVARFLEREMEKKNK